MDYRRYRKNVENVEIVDNSGSLDKYVIQAACNADSMCLKLFPLWYSRQVIIVKFLLQEIPKESS